jgi:lipoprotein NlpD
MEISDFLYLRVRSVGRDWTRLGLPLLLAAVGWGCAAAHRETATSPQSVPARAVAITEDAEQGERAGSSEEEGEIHHLVQPGQTLWRIARSYGVTVEELARANGIEDPTRISAGELLFVPGARQRVAVPPYPAGPGERAEARLAPPEASPGHLEDWIWPVEQGRILSYFGARRPGHRHGGIDIGGAHGAPVRAARSGRVTYSGSGMRGYGKTVIIDHGDGFSSLYAHNTRLLVQVGQRVEQGVPVALLGRSGNATADHCHFEIRRENRAVDPLHFLHPPLEAQR